LKFEIDSKFKFMLQKKKIVAALIPTKMGVFGKVGKEKMKAKVEMRKKKERFLLLLAYSLLLLCSVNSFGGVWRKIHEKIAQIWDV
jgi:hypothetical protein